MLHGIVNIYKEKGYTSHDVVARLRKITGQKKIGHTGTLDPDAEGVLPVCFGKATKVCGLLTEKDKKYRAVLLLGLTTDTQDITGTVLQQCSTGNLDEKEAVAAVLDFAGAYDQIPPMYSALKVDGKKLYELAREGKTVPRKARRVQIYDIRILKAELPRIEMEVSCSKGTYIRTLCHDIGEKIGCGGCMESLVRTQSGDFEIGESHRLGEILEKKEAGELEKLLIPVDTVFSKYQKIRTGKEQDRLLQNGNPFTLSGSRQKFSDQEYVRVYDSEDHFTAVCKYIQEEDRFRVVKMFL